MPAIISLEGDLTPQDLHLGIVATRFNGFIVDHLLTGALDTLRCHGVDEHAVEIVRVPGAYELPLAVKAMVRRSAFDGLIALGCVIRGATPHFEYVAGACARGLADIALEFELPVAFGVLTTDSVEQAIERAGTKAGNKGAEAARTVLEMVSLLRKLSA